MGAPPIRPPICIDIDNVIAQTDEVMRKVIKSHSRQGVDLRYEDVVFFDYDKCRDLQGRSLEPGEWAVVHELFTRDHLDEIQPTENVAQHLDDLGRLLEIHLVTSRLPEGRAGTQRWLSQHSIPHDQLHFSRHRKKHEIPTHFAAAVDDDREQASLFNQRGVASFILAHPWNVVEKDCPITRLNSWPEIVDAVRRHFLYSW